MYGRTTALALLFSLALAGCGGGPRPAPETGARAEAAEEAHGTAPHWGYEGAEGPENWGSLSPDFATCASGREQSPVDLDPAVLQTPESEAEGSARLTLAEEAPAGEILSNGHTVQVNFPGGSELSVGDASFELLQFHFHAPSENTVAGEHFPLEAHLVHASAEGALAVVGVLFEEGAASPALAGLRAHLPAEAGPPAPLGDGVVDLAQLLPESQTHYRFTGSLTTPPCSEGVRWFVMSQPLTASSEQIARFTAILGGNNRPVQPLNDRRLEGGDSLLAGR